MKNTTHTSSFLRSILCVLACTISVISMGASFNYPEKDTVILELENNTRIVIITESKSDLQLLESYDLNQMVKDLNAQLNDSIDYLEIDQGKTYANDTEVDVENWKIDKEHVRLKLGSIEMDINPDEMEDWDEDDWENREKITYESERAGRTTHHFNVDLGINNWVQDGTFPGDNNELYAVKPFGSWYVALNSTNHTWVTGSLFLDWGAGISWYNWKLQNEDVAVVEEPDRIAFIPLPDEINAVKSKLTASYINVHLLPMLDFSKGSKKVTDISSGGMKLKRYSRKGFRLGVGPYAGIRLGSHTKLKFEQDGDTEKDKEDDNFYLQNIRYGIRAQIGWKGTTVFAMYDLNEVFADGRGPMQTNGTPARLNAFTFGVTL